MPSIRTPGMLHDTVEFIIIILTTRETTKNYVYVDSIIFSLQKEKGCII